MVKSAAQGRWHTILANLQISVPNNPRQHSPCPTCGGKDRFRFDDQDGGGSWYCNVCDPRAGDGIALVMNALSYRRRVHAPEGYRLRDRLAAWAAKILPSIDPYPSMPEGVVDRNADVWESLLSVADAVGGSWPGRARQAAVVIVADAKAGQPSLGLRLLTDLRTVFSTHEVLSTADILTSLISIEESPWGDLKGKPLDARRLANLLSPYAIGSKVVRLGTSTPRGYIKTDFYDPWIRYLPEKNLGATGAADPSPAGLFAERIVEDDH